MPIHGIVSTLPDQKWVAANEKELEWLRRQVELLQKQVNELRKSR